MIGGVRVVGVAADAASGGDPTAPVQAALLAAGVPVEGRVLVDDDEGAVDTPHGAFAVLPRGTPSPTLSGQLIDFARARVDARGVVTRTLRTVGVSLGDVEDRLAEWLGREGEVAVSTVPADGEVWVRL